jgi:hypothetical protein
VPFCSREIKSIGYISYLVSAFLWLISLLREADTSGISAVSGEKRKWMSTIGTEWTNCEPWMAPNWIVHTTRDNSPEERNHRIPYRTWWNLHSKTGLWLEKKLTSIVITIRTGSEYHFQIGGLCAINKIFNETIFPFWCFNVYWTCTYIYVS